MPYLEEPVHPLRLPRSQVGARGHVRASRDESSTTSTTMTAMTTSNTSSGGAAPPPAPAPAAAVGHAVLRGGGHVALNARGHQLQVDVLSEDINHDQIMTKHKIRPEL
jgi:hypothetical protein